MAYEWKHTSLYYVNFLMTVVLRFSLFRQRHQSSGKIPIKSSTSRQHVVEERDSEHYSYEVMKHFNTFISYVLDFSVKFYLFSYF